MSINLFYVLFYLNYCIITIKILGAYTEKLRETFLSKLYKLNGQFPVVL